MHIVWHAHLQRHYSCYHRNSYSKYNSAVFLCYIIDWTQKDTSGRVRASAGECVDVRVRVPTDMTKAYTQTRTQNIVINILFENSILIKQLWIT
jgi:hypothetical protein